MPAKEIRTGMGAILPVLVSRLALVTEFPPERILTWVGDSDPPHLQGDQDVVVVLAGFNPDQAWFTGGGRYTMRLTERIEVQARTRLALDPTGSAYIWLTDATLGHILLRNKVLNALAGFMPADADGNVLVTDCLKPVPSRRPKQDGSRASPVDWGSELLTFEVSYEQSVDTTLDDFQSESEA